MGRLVRLFALFVALIASASASADTVSDKLRGLLEAHDRNPGSDSAFAESVSLMVSQHLQAGEPPAASPSCAAPREAAPVAAVDDGMTDVMKRLDSLLAGAERLLRAIA